MQTDRRSFMSAAASSLVLGAARVSSASTDFAETAEGQPQTPPAPVSFPGIPNPLEGSVDVIASGYLWTEGPVWVGGENGHLLFSDVPGNAIYSWDGKRTTAFLAPSGLQTFPIPASIREAGWEPRQRNVFYQLIDEKPAGNGVPARRPAALPVLA